MDSTTTGTIKAIALDLGTTAIKAALLDQHGALCHLESAAAPELHHANGRWESDALAYAEVAMRVLTRCLRHTAEPLPLGLCCQRSSFLLWRRSTGQPVSPLISWQDTRGAASCTALHAHEDQIHQLTGLHLTPYYFAPKLRVLLDEHPEWRDALLRRELHVGTLDSFLIWRWTNGQHYLTDVSMAARTLLLDLRSGQWSAPLCQLFQASPAMLPTVHASAGLGIPLHQQMTLQASLADQSAALVATVRGGTHDVLVNLGTGGFVLTYQEGRLPAEGYLHTLVYRDATRRSHIALEGTLNSIASALSEQPVQECTLDDLGAGDLFCLAEPGGIGAPYFRSDLGLHFSGTTAQLSPRQLAALLLEGIIFRVARILEDFDIGAGISRVYLSGGLSELPGLQQGIAACAPCPVMLLQQHDASLLGAALLAAGMEQQHAPAATPIVVPPQSRLRDKYRRWKVWFDGLLAA